MEKESNYTLEEKKEFVERVTKWRSELKRFKNFNVYFHPNNPGKPYRKTFNNGYIKMVAWKIDDYGKFQVFLNDEKYDINVFEIEEYFNEFHIGTLYNKNSPYKIRKYNNKGEVKVL
jgi:hypothetical protein